MRQIHLKFLGLLIFFTPFFSFSQTIGDYQSVASGAWTTVATWQTWTGSWVAAVVAPASANNVHILTTHNITLSAVGGNCNNLTIDSGATLTAVGALNISGDLNINSTSDMSSGGTLTSNNTAVNVAGNWTNWTSTGFAYGAGTTVTFNGSGNTRITVNDFNGQDFSNLTINKSAGANVYLDDASQTSVYINGSSTMTLTSGIVYADTTYFAFNDVNFTIGAATVNGANNNSFVQGLVYRTGSTSFTYPVGADSEYRPVTIGTLSASATMGVEYFKQNPYYGSPTAYDTSKKNAPIDHVSGSEYWTIQNVTGSNVTGMLTLQWDTYSGGVTDMTNLLIADMNLAAKWSSLGHGATTGTLAQGTLSTPATITFPAAYSLPIAYTFASIIPDPGNPLPISLLSFTAQTEQHEVMLKWTTDIEINNDFFTVEKTIDGMNFNVVGKVKGAGNSTGIINYSLIDSFPYSGVSYYRLKQTDYDGHYTYSNLITIYFSLQITSALKLFPNPASDNIYISMTDQALPVTNAVPCDLRIFDMSGRQVTPKKTVGFSNGMLQTLDISDLPKGIYTIQLIADDQVQRISFLKD